MAGDFSTPATSQLYADTFSSTRDNLSDLAKHLDATSTINPPVGAKRWNATNRYWEVCSNSSGTGTWGKMVDDTTARYEIRTWKADQLTTARNFSITGDVSANAVSFDGTGVVNLSATISNLAATKGGTGQTAWTTGQILYSNTTNSLARLNVGTVGQYLRSTGSLPAWATIANGDLPGTFSSKTLDNTNTVTLLDNQFTLQDQTTPTKQAQFDCAVIAGGSLRTFTLPNASGTLLLTDEGTQTTVSRKTFNSTNIWQGATIGVGYGGTGAATHTTGGILTGNGSSAINSTTVTGLVKGNGVSVPSAASAADIVGYIGSTPVQNAGNATNWNGLALPTAGLAPAANGFARADASGYTYHSYTHHAQANGENPTVSQFMVTNGSDGYMRKASLAHVKAALTGTGTEVFTASGTWTKPTGLSANALVFVEMWGGGGGGGNVSTQGGGGGGAYASRWILASSLGATETVTVGVGGGVQGGGGNSSFGSHLIAYAGSFPSASLNGGGGGGTRGAGVPGTSGGAGGVGYGPGGEGGWGTGGGPLHSDWGGGGGGSSNVANAGGNSEYGGGGGGANSGAGGLSKYGGNGGAYGQPGVIPGGGGGTFNVGARGEVRVTVV